VPSPFHGLISSLAEFQTLLGDAVATGDPRLLAHALYAYPIKQNSRDSRALYRELIEIHKDEMPATLLGAKAYFRG